MQVGGRRPPPSIFLSIRAKGCDPLPLARGCLGRDALPLPLECESFIRVPETLATSGLGRGRANKDPPFLHPSPNSLTVPLQRVSRG